MKYYLFLFTILFSFVVFAQEKNDIQLRIIDSITEEPISYATIRFKGTNQGLIADFDGELRLPSKFVKDSITLLITSIGYQSKEVVLWELKKDIKNIIRLQIQIEALDPIFIKRRRVRYLDELKDAVEALTAEQIVQNAIDSIPIHLDNTAHSYVGYYRDYQIVNNTYYNLNEAILESYDQGIETKKLKDLKNQSALHLFEANPDFRKDTSLAVPYQFGEKFIESAKIPANGGNELSILNAHDPVRNYDINTFSFVDVFKTDFLKNHKVIKGELFYFDNIPIIKIPFVTENTVTEGVYDAKGDMYISLDDYSLYRFNYRCFEVRNPNPLYSISIEYKEQNDKMYLNYITFNNSFSIVDKNTLREDEILFYPVDSEVVITFNKYIDEKSVRRSAFKIQYKGRKVVVESFEVIGRNKVRVKILPLSLNEDDLRKVRGEDMSFKLRRIKDLKGKKIYERQDLQGYQFRELFVQEVFSNSSVPDKTLLVNKKNPLRESQINTNLEYKRYWINSPLKSTRTN